AGDFLGPTGEIERRAFELRPVEIAHAGIEHVYASICNGGKDLFQLLRRVGQSRAEILLLPLGETQYDGLIGADDRADAFYDFHSKLRPAPAITAPAIGAQIRLLPQEVVGQITMRSVDRDAVESDLHCVVSAPTVCSDDIGYLLVRHASRLDG